MKIKWLGHAAFLLTTSDGLKIITDPYESGSYDGAVGYGPINVLAQVVTVSHDHPDHNAYDKLPGQPRLVRGPGGVDLEPYNCIINGYPSWHDQTQGSQRGDNTIHTFQADGLSVCHLGDLGHLLSDETVEMIGRVDVLIVPVGGTFTIDAREAHRVVGQLKPRVVIPMHYKTAKLKFNVAPVDGFLTGLPVRRVGAAEVELAADSLPEGPEIWVLDHAL